jgi:uncharacterized protein (TIGR03663 family)
MSKRAFASLFLAVFILAVSLRTARLDLRPMHHDEANQAIKFGQLLEKGEYRYDPSDHHGPSLYYITLPFARVLSGASVADLSEKTLRLVTGSFGLGTIFLLLLFIPMMGRAAVAWASLALAVSPVMVYFSRFYIQETILVFFLAGFVAAVWRYIRRPGWSWASAAGLCAGMMYATKETSVIAFGAVATALVLASRLAKNPMIHEETRVPGRKSMAGGAWPHLLLATGIGLAVSFLFFSSFLQNPKGFLDSVLSFKVYFVRAGEGGFHVQPWHYYIHMLAFSRGHGSALWSEGLVLILALVGAVDAFRRNRRDDGDPAFLRFLVFYAALAAVVYSAIPYKTPWNLLPFYVGFIMLAGSGAAVLTSVPRRNPGKLAAALVLVAGFAQLGFQSYRTNFVYPADARNPYVYAQTSPDFLKLVRRVEDLALLTPEHQNMLIKVIAGPYETWPLPWYLRGFGRVGYWGDAGEAGDIDRPPVIISSAEETAKIDSVLSTAYRSEYYGLRPGVLLALSVRNDLWETFMKGRAR